jgi:hypothetical protein
MDATQKRRIKKVAIAHIVLSIAAGWWLVWTIEFVQGQWLSFPVFFSLQPLMLLINLAPSAGSELSSTTFGKTLVLLFILIGGISSVVWSFCFGWIFIRAKDWLNHFPVLGKRVF